MLRWIAAARYALCAEGIGASQRGSAGGGATRGDAADTARHPERRRKQAQPLPSRFQRQAASRGVDSSAPTPTSSRTLRATYFAPASSRSGHGRETGRATASCAAARAPARHSRCRQTRVCRRQAGDARLDGQVQIVTSSRTHFVGVHLLGAHAVGGGAGRRRRPRVAQAATACHTGARSQRPRAGAAAAAAAGPVSKLPSDFLPPLLQRRGQLRVDAPSDVGRAHSRLRDLAPHRGIARVQSVCKRSATPEGCWRRMRRRRR